MKRALLVLVLLVGTACDDKNESLRTLLTIDGDLSLSSSLGGDVGLAVNIERCSRIEGPAIATAAGRILATLETPEPLTFARGSRFIITIPAAAFDPQVFGFPVVLSLVITAVCDGERVATEPYAFTYVPTLRTLLPPSGVTRFWPSDVPGEILACSGTRLVRYDSQGSPIDLASAIDVGFPCNNAELRGEVGERRYLTVEGLGMAAIDPGPALAWWRYTKPGVEPRQEFLFAAAWTRAEGDVVAAHRKDSGGTVFVTLLDGSTGLDKTPTLPLVYKAFGPLSRGPGSSIDVLTWNKLGSENIYYLERFDAVGNTLGTPLEVSRYSSGTPYAEFSYDGARLYLTATDDGERAWIRVVDVASGSATELTAPGDGWRDVVGEAYSRLLVASQTELIWLDPSSGAPLSRAFGFDSGAAFYRLRVESDGSTIALADLANSRLASGFYVFAPDGTDVVRLHGDQFYGWLTSGWGGGSLVGVQDARVDIQEVPTASGFRDLLQ